jgi:hypothetical protein
VIPARAAAGRSTLLKPAQRNAISFTPRGQHADRLGIETVVHEPAHGRAAGRQRRGRDASAASR